MKDRNATLFGGAMRFAMAALLVHVWSTVAWAERRVALIFGTDRYATMRPLANAVNDARAMEEALIALNFEVFSETNRDLRRMRRALEDFEEDAAGADVALVFFAGHGVEIEGDNRLLPTDADASSVTALKASSLALGDVQRVLTRVAKTALIVLDACRNDPFATLSDPNGRGAFALDLPQSVRPGLGRMGAAQNTLFAFSAAPGETASDGEGPNSPFTTALTKYLGTDGLEIRSVLTLVQQEVYDRTRGAQLPYVESGLPSLFFASQTPSTLPEREQLLLAMADIDESVRFDVERIARDTGAPLAPLYGALIGSDLAAQDREARQQKLTEAATAFIKVRDELRLLRSGDAQVTALRQEAEAQLSLGAFETARAKLTEAAAIDASSRETLKANLMERTLSEAATHYLNGGAAQAELRYQLALADHRKAATLFDEVSDAAFPAAARGQQLSALEALGRINITIGNLPAAAEAFARQLTASQAAATHFDGDLGLQLSLALARDNFGDVLFEQGQIGDALVQFRAGQALREDLAALYPDDSNIRFALSNSYQRLGQIHHRQGDLAAAEGYYQQKYNLAAATLARGAPGYRWARDLSLSDELLGDVARERGDLETSLGHYEASLDRMVPIREANPQDLNLARFTSVTLDRIGDVLAAQGDLVFAQERYEESRRLREVLVAADPANVDWQYVLGISHERLGDLLSRLGDMPAATRAFEAKHAIARLLAEGDPTNVRWLRDLSVADERLGSLARGRGELDVAESYFQSSLGRMTAVREASPEDMELTRFLSFTQDLLAGVQMDRGAFESALAFYRQSLALRERLVAVDPQNPDWQFILGVSHELIGNTHMQMSQPEAAARAYRQELDAMSALLAQDPDNPRWRRAVSVTNELIGDAERAAGNLEEAVAQYTQSLNRMRPARDAAPRDLALQRFIAVTAWKIGRARLEAEAFGEARKAYRESRDIAADLVAANPSNGWWLRDLFIAATGLVEAGSQAEADLVFALNVIADMKALGIFRDSDAPVEARLRKKLGVEVD
ncbi:MAG: caspase family protein [Pseudomonadota bacterium]